MEGGIAIFLLLVLIAVIAAIAFGLLSTGGALSLRRRAESKEEAEQERRPTHTRPTTEYHENTAVVGVDDEPERSKQR